MTKSALDTLLEAAVLAPSGDNTQPWHFAVDRKHWKISIDVDPVRDPSPMNAQQRMARIALVGAAIENMVLTAERNGWKYEIQDPRDDGVSLLKLLPTQDVGTIDPVLYARVTNRRVYEGGDISGECIKRLKSATDEFPSARAYWITDRPELATLCDLIARADALILGTKPIRDAFLAKVRFDQPTAATVDEGLSLGSLEVSAFERQMLKVMRFMPDTALRLFGARRVFTQVAKKLAGSAAGMLLITAPDQTVKSGRGVGRLWQRAWLAMTEQGLASQPMMSLPVLQNVRDTAATRDVLSNSDKIASDRLLAEFHAFAESFATGSPAVLMRFGHAASPTSRVGRLKPPQLTSEQ